MSEDQTLTEVEVLDLAAASSIRAAVPSAFTILPSALKHGGEMPKTRHTDEEAHAFLVQAEKDIQSKQRAQQESKRSVTGVPQTLQEGEMPSLGPDVEKISPDESGEKALSCGKEPDSHMLHSSNKDTNTLALSENQFSQQGGGLLEGSTGNQPVGGGDDGTDDKLGQEAGTQEVMNSVSPLESESQTLNCYLVGVMSMKASAESVLTEAPCTEVAAGLDPEAPGLDLMGQQSGSLEHPHCSTGQNEKGDRQCAVIKEVTAPVKDSAEERGGQGSQDQCKARGELEAEGYTGLKADNQGEGRAGPMGGCGSESEEEQKGKVEKSKEEGGQREKVNKANTLDVGHVHKLEDSKRIDDPLIAQGGDSFKQAGGSKCAQESNFQGGTVKQEEGSKGEAATACQTALGMLVVSKAAKQPQALDADLPGRGYPDSAKESMPSKPPHGVHPQHRVAGNSRSLQAGRTRKRTAKSLEYREPPMPMEKAQTVVMEAIIELSNQADGPVTKIARTDVLAHLTHRELSHDRNVQIALCYYYEPTRFKLGSNSLGTTTQPEGSVDAGVIPSQVVVQNKGTGSSQEPRMHMGSKTSDFWTAWKKPKGRDAVGQVGNVSGTELAVASGTQGPQTQMATNTMTNHQQARTESRPGVEK